MGMSEWAKCLFVFMATSRESNWGGGNPMKEIDPITHKFFLELLDGAHIRTHIRAHIRA